MRTRKDPIFNKQQLGNLLEKYKKRLVPPQASVEKEARLVIGELFELDLNDDSITYTPATKTLSLNLPSVLKTEIKKQEKQVLDILKTRLGEHSSPKIIL